MPDEKVATPPVAEAPPTVASVDKMVVDGVEYTPAEIVRIRDTRINLEKDFQRKQEALAKERKAVATQGQESRQAAQQLAQEAANLKADRDFYTTHSAAEWEAYTPKSKDLATPAGSAPVVDDTRLSKLEASVEFLVNQTVAGTATKDVDTVLKFADTACDKYELASERAVLAEIKSFRMDNDRMPTAEEVMNLAKDIHNDLAKKGVKKVISTTTPTPTEPSSEKLPPQEREKEKMPDLRNMAAFSTAAEKWLAKKRVTA